MASIVDAFNDALSEDFAYMKIIVFAIPVYFVINLFLVGKMSMFTFYGSIVGVLLLSLLTVGINNVRRSRKEILTLNFLTLGIALLKTVAVVVPQALIFGSIGYCLTNKVILPVDLPHFSLIYSILVWAIIFSIVLTSYLSFAKYMKILQGYNYKVIFEACIDILVSFLFFIPQLALANIVLLGPVAYLYSFFHLPFEHWGFVAYSSAVIIINVSILANYLAQASYENIKGNNEEYDENVQLNVIEASAERLNGR